MKNLLKLSMPVLAAILAGCASRQPAPMYVVPPPRPFPPGAVAVPPGGAFPTNIPPSSVPPGSFVPQGAFPTAPGSPNPPASPVPPPPTQSFPVPPPMSSIPPGEPLDKVGYRWQPYGPQQSPPTYPPTNVYSPPPGTRQPPLNDPLQGSTPPTQPYTPPTPPVPPLVSPAPPTTSERPEVLLLPPRPDVDPPAKDVIPKEIPKDAPKTTEPPPNDKDRYYPPEEKKTEPEKRPAPLPVGIFGYDKARENVTTGQRPTLEGLDFLEKNGVKTVVFLHAPGDAVDTDRQQVEKRGMTFVAIEINAKDLHRDSVERFLKIQAESKTDKIFVYDVDGSLTGAMWYLSFRLIDRDSDDAARVRSNALGQNETRESARALWEETRRYLEMK